MEPLEESSLVGLAILSAQKLEFAFYGIIAHVSKENESKQTRPFKGLTPESFLRGDIKELRATFGQLNYHFGDLFLLNNEEFELFIKDRNIIAHNYWRLTKAKIRDGQTLENPKEFLLGFIERCQYWEKIFKGLLWIFQSALAIKFKREDEFVLNAEQELEIQFYYQHAEKFQQEKKQMTTASQKLNLRLSAGLARTAPLPPQKSLLPIYSSPYQHLSLASLYASKVDASK